MSQNPRGRPTKSTQQKKQAKKLSDHKRYLKSKSIANTTSASSLSVAHPQAIITSSEKMVCSEFVYN